MIQTHLMPKWLPPWPCVEATTALSKGAPAPLPSRQFPVSALNLCLSSLPPKCPIQGPEATYHQLPLGFQPAWLGIGGGR